MLCALIYVTDHEIHFEDFQSGANNPTTAPIVETEQQAVHSSMYSTPMPSDLPYWERT